MKYIGEGILDYDIDGILPQGTPIKIYKTHPDSMADFYASPIDNPLNVFNIYIGEFQFTNVIYPNRLTISKKRFKELCAVQKLSNNNHTINVLLFDYSSSQGGYKLAYKGSCKVNDLQDDFREEVLHYYRYGKVDKYLMVAPERKPAPKTISDVNLFRE